MQEQRRARPLYWFRAHLQKIDIGFAVLVTLANLFGLLIRDYGAGVPPFKEPDFWAVLFALAAGAPLAVRRRYPITAALVICGGYYLAGFLGYSSVGGSFAVLVAMYTLGMHAALLPGLLLVAASTGGSLVYAFMHQESFATQGQSLGPEVLGAIVIQFIGLWAVGRTLRARRIYLDDLEDRADRLERTAAAEVRAALAEERTRVARELHDVVAHHVSVMTVQAAAARRTVKRAPDRSIEAMQAVEETGREALAEMRRIVGALRETDEGTEARELAPQAGVSELDHLIERAREAGLEVDFTVVGEQRTLPSSVDLAIFRVVQESLTNTLKHAGPTRAAVLLRYEPEVVVVAVTDDGSRGRGQRLAAPDGNRRPGHGLVGMRERVTLNGGTLETRPRSVGGFEVVARLPLDWVAS